MLKKEKCFVQSDVPHNVRGFKRLLLRITWCLVLWNMADELPTGKADI
jgi:hypothetical protein